MNNQLTETFRSTCGIKQGCNLSPTMSNLYQSDLHEIFDNNCKHVKLGNTEINPLSYADDLILLSSTAEGLQTVLINYISIVMNGT